MAKFFVGLFFVILALIFAAVYFGKEAIQQWNPLSSGPVELTVWGLWDDEKLFQVLINEYKKIHPEVQIKYTRQTFVNYRPRVQNQISRPEGPDIIMIHNTWLPMFLVTKQLAPAPPVVITARQVEKEFYPIVYQNFVRDGDVYALPMGLDGLLLYYNEEILRNANIPVPTTWGEFAEAAVNATVKDSQGNVLTAGAAIGLPDNVDHWSDILGLLFYHEPQTNLAYPSQGGGSNVLHFFTGFVVKREWKVWSKEFDNSTKAFADGKVAFYFGPYWRYLEIRNLNPNLKFKAAAVPKLPGQDPISWASYWGYAVSKNSSHPKQAWEFIKFITNADTQRSFYLTAKQAGVLAYPYSRIELKDDPTLDEYAKKVVEQAPYFRSWYLSSNTLDQALNDEMIEAYKRAVVGVINGGDPKSELEEIQPKVQEILSKYGAI